MGKIATFQGENMGNTSHDKVSNFSSGGMGVDIAYPLKWYIEANNSILSVGFLPRRYDLTEFKVCVLYKLLRT